MRGWQLGLRCFLLPVAYASTLGAGGDPPGHRREQRHASLVYERSRGAERCPDISVLRRSVQSHLGYDAFEDGAALQIRCDVAARGTRLIASIKVSDRASGLAGERNLVAPRANCAELADALALAIAIAIDPLLPSDGAAAAGSGPPEENPPPAPTAHDDGRAMPQQDAPDPVDRTHTEYQATADQRPVPIVVSIGAGPSLAYALEPNLAVGLSLGLMLRRGPLFAQLDAHGQAPSHLRYRTGTVTAQLFTAAIAACLDHRGVNICGVGEAGFLAGAAEGYAYTTHDRTPFLAAGLRLGWQQPISSKWSALVYATGLVPVIRTTLWVDSEPIWTTPLLAVRLGLLGFFAFP